MGGRLNLNGAKLTLPFTKLIAVSFVLFLVSLVFSEGPVPSVPVSPIVSGASSVPFPCHGVLLVLFQKYILEKIYLQA
jgi:hypothetical protein